MRTMTAEPALFSPLPARRRDPGATLELTGPHSFIGDPVCNHRGSHLGSIREIMLDLGSGKIAYAVLSQGAAFYTEGKMVAVPWEALAPGAGPHRFMLQVEKSRFDAVPGFTYDNWPDMDTAAWSPEVWCGEVAEAA